MTNTRINVPNFETPTTVSSLYRDMLPALSSTSPGVMERIGRTFADALSDPSAVVSASMLAVAISFGYGSRGNRVSVSVFRGVIGAVAGTFVWKLHPTATRTAVMLLLSSWIGAALGDAAYRGGEDTGAEKGSAEKEVQRKSAPLHPNTGISEEVHI